MKEFFLKAYRIKITKLTICILLAFSFWGCSHAELGIDKSFNENWLFYQGNIENAEKSNFDDSNWRQLNLPHDWAIEGQFSSENNARTGGLPVHGTAWYRKHFYISKENSKQIVSVEFDGAMSNAYIWVNGQLLGNRPSGYIGFEFDITPYINFGASNVIAVRLQPEDLASRWYPGAGIYRNVHIKFNNKLHIPQWGTKVRCENISKESASIHIVSSVRNQYKTSKMATLLTNILDQDGKVVTSVKSEIVIQAGTTGLVHQSLQVQNPKLWDIDNANIYTAESTLRMNGQSIDRYQTNFGIRKIEFTKDKGFLLNEKPIKLHGVCMHHDLGPLGTAVNYRAIERQMQIMKNMGVNALRTSHNPPAPEMLDVCDRLGILVIDEAFDEWEIGKVPNGYHKFFEQWHEKDLRDLIRRDYNHPSVIMWSIGNEILEQSKKDGWKVAKTLSRICHEEDSTRPTTAGFNYYPAPFDNHLAEYVDIVGMNYWPLHYQEILNNHQDMIIYGSETSSQTSSRGVYHLPIQANEKHETNQVSSYDAIVGPPWAYPPDVEFEQQEKNSRSLGQFIWTGFDYLGEPTPYGGRDNSTHGYWNDDWPSHSSYFAPVDLCGFPKDRYYLFQSQWTQKPMVHVLPHWNWKGHEGDSIPVFAYTNCEEVELFVNGKSYGKKRKGIDLTPIPAEFHGFKKGIYQSKYRLFWKVPYQPGNLRVVAYTNGTKQAEKTIKTAGKALQIKLIPDRSSILSDGKDLSFITVRVEDGKGNLCPNANNLIKFSVQGEAEIVAVGNGDATCLSSFKAKQIHAFNGLCLLVVKSNKVAGKINIMAESNELQDTKIKIVSHRD